MTGETIDDWLLFDLTDKLHDLQVMIKGTESAYRRGIMLDRADRLTAAICKMIGVSQALVRRGRVMVPFEVGGVMRLFTLELRDLDAEADEHGVKLLGRALRRLSAGEFLDDRDHRRVVETLYLLIDCSAEEAEVLIARLREADCPISPAELARMASAYLEVDRAHPTPTVADQVLETFTSSLDLVLGEDL